MAPEEFLNALRDFPHMTAHIVWKLPVKAFASLWYQEINRPMNTVVSGHSLPANRAAWFTEESNEKMHTIRVMLEENEE